MLGVVQSADGLPLHHEVHIGNVAELRTLKGTLERAMRRFPIRRVIAIADRGLMSADNLEELAAMRTPSGVPLEYVSSGAADRARPRPDRRRHRHDADHLFLGTFLERIAMVFITVPVFTPVVTQLGYDPIRFGILFAMNVQIYMLSPPLGPACFYLKSVAPKDVTLQEVFLAALPFTGLQIVGLALVMTFPQIARFLPGL